MKNCLKLSIALLTLFFNLSAFAERLPPIRVLSIDGGGVRGIIPATVLAQLEKELNLSVAQIFDLVVGTSSGAITAFSLVAPNENGTPLYSADEVVDLYHANASEIFSASIAHQIRTAGGLFGPKYDSVGLRNVVQRSLQDLTMKDALVPIIVTGYHIAGRTGVEFSSIEATTFPSDKNCKMADVAMATAAAPVYFGAVDVNYPWGVLHAVVDGGVYKNNPALIAYVNAKQLFPDREIDVYSLGTGRISIEELDRDLMGRGFIHWIEPIIRHIQIGDSSADNTILHKLTNEDGEENFFRLDIEIGTEHRKMDDIDPENLDYLYNRGIALTQSEAFRIMLNRLKYGLERF